MTFLTSSDSTSTSTFTSTVTSTSESLKILISALSCTQDTSSSSSWLSQEDGLLTAYLLPTSQYPLLPHISLLIDLGNDNEFERAKNQNLAKAGIVNLISSHKLHKALGKRQRIFLPCSTIYNHVHFLLGLVSSAMYRQANYLRNLTPRQELSPPSSDILQTWPLHHITILFIPLLKRRSAKCHQMNSSNPIITSRMKTRQFYGMVGARRNLN